MRNIFLPCPDAGGWGSDGSSRRGSAALQGPVLALSAHLHRAAPLEAAGSDQMGAEC